MDPDFWHRKWENNDIGFHIGEVNPLLVNSFGALSLEKGSRVFLPLCGKTVDIAWLLSQDYRVVGIEINESAIQQLFDELKVNPDIAGNESFMHYRAANLDILVGDFFDLTPESLGHVDAIYDRAALVALPKEMRRRYASHLTAITNHAPQLLITYEYDQREMDGPPFSVSKAEVREHYDESYDVTLLDSFEVPGGFKGRFPALESVWLLN